MPIDDLRHTQAATRVTPEGNGPWAIGDPAVEGGISPSDGNANQGDAGVSLCSDAPACIRNAELAIPQVCYCFLSPCGPEGNATKLADTAGGSRMQWLERCVESGTVTPPLPVRVGPRRHHTRDRPPAVCLRISMLDLEIRALSW